MIVSIPPHSIIIFPILNSVTTPTTLYKIDCPESAWAVPVFIADADDSILTRMDINAYGQGVGQGTAVATKHFVILFRRTGRPFGKYPTGNCVPTDYTDVQVYSVEKSGQFVLSFHPSTVADRKADWSRRLPTHVVWVEPSAVW